MYSLEYATSRVVTSSGHAREMVFKVVVAKMRSNTDLGFCGLPSAQENTTDGTLSCWLVRPFARLRGRGVTTCRARRKVLPPQ